MRKKLSELLVEAAKQDPKFIVLSGDHGYALFDELRSHCPDQFVNCGVAEQSMVGIAAGLARQGFKVVVYGLAAFIPMRALEQIKLDICYSNLPVVFLGDGAGLVYSHLGASHQCAEDIAALMPMPNISIYSPSDAEELEDSWNDAMNLTGPSYVRIGKDNLPPAVTQSDVYSNTCVVATGSMVYPASKAAKTHQVEWVSCPFIKPIPVQYLAMLSGFDRLIVIEEHSEHGGLASILRNKLFFKDIRSVALKEQFSDKCGSYQYALSEHEMDDASIDRRIGEIINGH